ncbi:MAG TPA: GNAT family N-acetyltransferase [Flavobacterium sp.]
MKKYTVTRYVKEHENRWNSFIGTAKNATFLFHRDFMEYHAVRFADFSLVVFEKNEVVAVLPANLLDDTLHSHQGLTYGGFVFQTDIKLGEALQIISEALEYLDHNHIKFLRLKVIPMIYNSFSSDEILYALFLLKADLYRRDSLSVVDLQKPFRLSKDRVKCALRGSKNNLQIREENNFEQFWAEILIPNMSKKHNATPVHTAAEIKRLQLLFPDNIRHFNVYIENKLIAGTTIFVTDQVAHPQYISGNEYKNETGSLDYLYSHLIKEIFNDKQFFDLGPSNEQNGQKINEGMLFWKESFGAKTVVQDFYELKTANFGALKSVML